MLRDTWFMVRTTLFGSAVMNGLLYGRSLQLAICGSGHRTLFAVTVNVTNKHLGHIARLLLLRPQKWKSFSPISLDPLS